MKEVYFYIIGLLTGILIVVDIIGIRFYLQQLWIKREKKREKEKDFSTLI